MAPTKPPTIAKKIIRKYSAGVRLSDEEKDRLFWIQDELSRREGTTVDLADVQRTAINYLYECLYELRTNSSGQSESHSGKEAT
jgi:hypothetical protein